MLGKHHGYSENSVEGRGDSQPGAEVVGLEKGSSEKGFELNSGADEGKAQDEDSFVFYIRRTHFLHVSPQSKHDSCLLQSIKCTVFVFFSSDFV